MIVVRKMAAGVRNHASVRFNEWLGCLPLIPMGYVFFSQQGIFEISASFAVMKGWLAQGAWANVLLTAGLLRLVALVINGTFPISSRYSPVIRFVASWAALMSWSAIFISTYLAWLHSGGSPTAPIMYGSWACLELRNVYTTRADMNPTRGAAYAGVRK